MRSASVLQAWLRWLRLRWLVLRLQLLPVVVCLASRCQHVSKSTAAFISLRHLVCLTLKGWWILLKPVWVTVLLPLLMPAFQIKGGT